jgi:hypothetical protein
VSLNDQERKLQSNKKRAARDFLKSYGGDHQADEEHGGLTLSGKQIVKRDQEFTTLLET